MIGTLIAIVIGVIVVSFAAVMYRGDTSRPSRYGKRAHSHYRRRF